MLERVIELTAETLGAEAESITEATSFTEDLHADSLDLFELAMALEEEFSVEIPSGKDHNSRRRYRIYRRTQIMIHMEYME